jgi:hypothetical protein
MERERMLRVLSLLPVNYALIPPVSSNALYTAISQVKTAVLQHSISNDDATLAVEYLVSSFILEETVVSPTCKLFSGAAMMADTGLPLDCDKAMSNVVFENHN